MAVDYEKIALKTAKMIMDNGRLVTFTSESTRPADNTKPWDGPADDSESETQLWVVAVPPSQIRQFGLTALGQGVQFQDLVKFSEQIFIVYPQDYDMRRFDHVIDDDEHWTITGLQILKPSDKIMLAYVGVRR